MNLGDNQKKRLLQIARRAILSSLRRERIDHASCDTDELHRLVAPAFVTLTKNRQLRGCIGQLHPEKPLGELIARMACEAAFHDPRFPPLALEEAADIEVEISILTPLEPVGNSGEIHPGEDGLVVEGHGHKGLLLPQVAAKYRWDSSTFLAQTCHKAGLPKDAWKDPHVKIWKFQALVFSDNDFAEV